MLLHKGSRPKVGWIALKGTSMNSSNGAKEILDSEFFDEAFLTLIGATSATARESLEGTIQEAFFTRSLGWYFPVRINSDLDAVVSGVVWSYVESQRSGRWTRILRKGEKGRKENQDAG